MKINDERQRRNAELFKNKLEEIVGDNQLFEKFGDEIKKSTFSISGADSLVGDGTLLDVVLRKLTPMAIKLNELLPVEIQIERNSLIKVCLLHHIAKSQKLIKNDNQWEIEKRGIFYKYNQDMPSIRTGLHSLAMAQEAGIQFTLEEVEAMTINDAKPDDDMAKYHSSVFANIIRMANELVYITENEINKE